MKILAILVMKYMIYGTEILQNCLVFIFLELKFAIFVVQVF